MAVCFYTTGVRHLLNLSDRPTKVKRRISKRLIDDESAWTELQEVIPLIPEARGQSSGKIRSRRISDLIAEGGKQDQQDSEQYNWRFLI